MPEFVTKTVYHTHPSSRVQKHLARAEPKTLPTKVLLVSTPVTLPRVHVTGSIVQLAIRAMVYTETLPVEYLKFGLTLPCLGRFVRLLLKLPASLIP
ncbi:hypothetical protein BaRGS_00022316 [Batillaria attramentaria]|uniref:Uncharacterized protein n=1 Tax=Batillaria attramentaria TaxID=370345 RepID=A0ABD0KH88_9CAEN